MVDASEHVRVVREMVQQDSLFRKLAILEVVEPANNGFGKITLVLVKKAITSTAVDLAATHSPQTW